MRAGGTEALSNIVRNFPPDAFNIESLTSGKRAGYVGYDPIFTQSVVVAHQVRQEC